LDVEPLRRSTGSGQLCDSLPDTFLDPDGCADLWLEQKAGAFAAASSDLLDARTYPLFYGDT
jgi:hypothetical protein